MNSLDFLYISLAIGFLVIATLLGLLTYHLIMTLKSINQLFKNIMNIKNTLQSPFILIISAIISLLKRGGGR